MYKSITLRAFAAEWPTQRRLHLARQAKYDGVEVNLEPDGEYTLESDEQDLVNLRREVEQLGLRVSSVYSRQQWFNPITSQDEEIRRRGQRIIERLAWAASVLGTDAVLVVPGAVDNSLFVPKPEITPYDVAYRNALAVLREAVRSGERHQVTLAVENVWGKFLLSPMEFAHFIDEVGSERIGAYFDVGNVLRLGFPEHWIPILSSRIKRVHFKDFRLSVDTLGGFVGLLEGDVNWPAVRGALRQIGYDSWVTAEVLPPYRHLSERLIYETSANLDAILDQL